eukprot:11639980-Alexandrium_andersonii.AAC.1
MNHSSETVTRHSEGYSSSEDGGSSSKSSHHWRMGRERSRSRSPRRGMQACEGARERGIEGEETTVRDGKGQTVGNNSRVTESSGHGHDLTVGSKGGKEHPMLDSGKGSGKHSKDEGKSWGRESAFSHFGMKSSGKIGPKGEHLQKGWGKSSGKWSDMHASIDHWNLSQ